MSKVMLDAEYLRQQANACLHLARTTFDLTTAERLRFMATKLQAKANEINDADMPKLHIVQRNGSPRNGSTDGRG